MDETLYSDPSGDTQVVAPTQAPQNTQAPAQTQASPQTQAPAPTTQGQSPAPAAPAAQQPYQPHNVFGKIFEILGGGPKYSYKADPNTGELVKTDVTTKGDLTKSIVAGALTGLFSGAQYHGPGAGLHAFGMGGEAAAGMASKADAEKRQQAIEDAKNQQETQLRKAQIFNTNAEAIHNVRNAEKIQGDILDDMVARDSAQLAEVPDDGVISKNIPQDEALAKLKSGEFNGGQVLFLVDGKTVQKDANGNDVIDPRTGERKMETTVSIVNNVPVPLSKEDTERYVAAHIPGFAAGVAPAEGTKVPLVTKRAWDNQVHSVEIARGIAKDVGSDEEFSKALETPGAANALKDFSRFAGLHDPYAAIKQMEGMKNKDGNPVYTPRTIGILTDAFGGKKAQDYHDQLAAEAAANKKTAEEFSIIDTDAKANAVLAAPGKFAPDQIKSATNYLQLSREQGANKASQEARARAVAEGKDVEAMYKTGVNPITKEKLSIDNAPDSMLVDAKGRPVPQNQQTLYKPSQNEKQTGDTARQALAISADLRAAVAKNPSLVGPLLGNSRKGLAALGLGTGEAQKLLDDVNFLQSAATKVHTGRFSSEILKKMGSMVQPGMNTSQFLGGLDSIDEVMNRYALEDKLVTVADYRSMQTPVDKAPSNLPPKGATMKVPDQKGVMHWSDGKNDLGVVQ